MDHEVEAEHVLESALLEGDILYHEVVSSTERPVSLKQREDIARAAFKTWFRIKPGHKEIKDNWWALYYRKILPQYQMRDNHLGRKLNQWIEEDLREYLQKNKKIGSDSDGNALNIIESSQPHDNSSIHQHDTHHHHLHTSDIEVNNAPSSSIHNSTNDTIHPDTTTTTTTTISTNDTQTIDNTNSSQQQQQVQQQQQQSNTINGTQQQQQQQQIMNTATTTESIEEMLEAATTPRKRKANSSKEGTLPAYLNVELVQPPKITGDPHQIIPAHVLDTAKFCVNGDIYWTPESLTEDIAWFKLNRDDIMRSIPSVTGKPKSSSTPVNPSPSQKRPRKTPQNTTNHPNMNTNHHHHHQQHNGLGDSSQREVHIVCSAPWIRYDVFKTQEAYLIKFDVPGIIPGQDYIVETYGDNRIVVKGKRKSDSEQQQDSHNNNNGGIPHHNGVNGAQPEFLLNLPRQLRSRNFGPFEIEILFPIALLVDISKTEQSYRSGTLTVKCPLRLNDEHLQHEDNESMMDEEPGEEEEEEESESELNHQ